MSNADDLRQYADVLTKQGWPHVADGLRKIADSLAVPEEVTPRESWTEHSYTPSRYGVSAEEQEKNDRLNKMLEQTRLHEVYAISLLRRMRQWDMWEKTGDGPYWKAEIDKVLK